MDKGETWSIVILIAAALAIGAIAMWQNYQSTMQPSEGATGEVADEG